MTDLGTRNSAGRVVLLVGAAVIAAGIAISAAAQSTASVVAGGVVLVILLVALAGTTGRAGTTGKAGAAGSAGRPSGNRLLFAQLVFLAAAAVGVAIAFQASDGGIRAIGAALAGLVLAVDLVVLALAGRQRG